METEEPISFAPIRRVAPPEPETLSVFYQLPDGNFRRASQPLSVDSPNSVVAADVDGDGDLDIACDSNDANTGLAVFYQTTPGRFLRAERELATGSAPRCFAAADVDGDGDVDLVAGEDSSDGLVLFLQSEPGQFAPGRLLIPSGETYVVATADLDQDSDHDLIAVGATPGGPASLTLLLQTTPGTFAPSENVLYTGQTASFVTSADIDSDGDTDLVCGIEDRLGIDDDLILFFQTDRGVFEPALDPIPLPSEPRHTAVADLDADGALDLIVPSRGHVDILWQTTPGNFALATNPIELYGYEETSSILTVDLDADGNLDLVATSASYWRNDGAVNFVLQVTPGEFTTTGLRHALAPQSAASGDFDGDGDIDVATLNSADGTVTLFTQTGPGVFEEQPNTPYLGRPSTSLSAADINQDGRLDLISADGYGVIVFLQSHPGRFAAAPRTLSQTGPNNYSLVVSDVDGDDDVDLITANGSAGGLTLYYGGH